MAGLGRPEPLAACTTIARGVIGRAFERRAAASVLLVRHAADMHRKVRALRPLLRGLVLAAIVLVSADLALLVLNRWPSVALPPWLTGGWVSVAVSVALLAIVAVLAHRLVRALDRAEGAARQQQQVLDALQAGLVLFDTGGRIVFCNAHFQRSYAGLGAAAQPGATYEQLLRAVVSAGMAPEAKGHEDDLDRATPG